MGFIIILKISEKYVRKVQKLLAVLLCLLCCILSLYSVEWLLLSNLAQVRDGTEMLHFIIHVCIVSFSDLVCLCKFLVPYDCLSHALFERFYCFLY